MQGAKRHVTMQSVHKDLEFDGLWIDMNEPSNYCTGDVCWNDGEPCPLKWEYLHQQRYPGPSMEYCPLIHCTCILYCCNSAALQHAKFRAAL